MDKKRRIKYETAKDIPDYIADIQLDDFIRWNGTKYWNRVVRISENYLVVRRNTRWGGVYELVSRRKNPNTINFFGEAFLQHDKISLLDFLSAAESTKSIESWLLPTKQYIYFLEIRRCNNGKE